MTREGLPGARPAGPGPSGSRCPDAWRSPQPRARPRVLASPTAVAGNGRFSADGRRADVWPRVTVRERGREPGGWLWRPHAPARTRGPSERCLGAPANTRCRVTGGGAPSVAGVRRGGGALHRPVAVPGATQALARSGQWPQWTVAAFGPVTSYWIGLQRARAGPAGRGGASPPVGGTVPLRRLVPGGVVPGRPSCRAGVPSLRARLGVGCARPCPWEGGS